MVPEQNPLTGVKVMVIDDSNTIRRSAEIFLLQAGCTVILAEDGFDALAKIADHQPNLVFVDLLQQIVGHNRRKISLPRGPALDQSIKFA